MQQKDYVSSGSWNIQDEIQRLRSKATEDLLIRHESPKLDKILEVVNVNVKPTMEPQPEDEIVNLASEGGTLGLGLSGWYLCLISPDDSIQIKQLV